MISAVKDVRKTPGEMREIDAKIGRVCSLLAETTRPAPLLRKIESPEQERTAIQ